MVDEVDEGKVDGGKVDEGKVDEGKVDEGKVDEGKVDVVLRSLSKQRGFDPSNIIIIISTIRYSILHPTQRSIQSSPPI